MTKPATAPPVATPPLTTSSSPSTALTTSSTAISTPSPTAPPAPTPASRPRPPTDWAAAQRRAHDRITSIANRRNEEASSPSLARRIFGSSLGVGVVGSASERPAFRVGQLDTELLDEELLELLKEQLHSGVKALKPSLTESFAPELMLLLRAVLFKLSIWDHNATYGSLLQNLHYTDARSPPGSHRAPTRAQKSIYGFVTVFGRYFYSRLDNYLIQHPTSHPKLSALMDKLSNLHSALTLLSFLAFLRSGRYRTLLDRVLRMRLVPPDNTVAREVSFEFLNRQLVWHAFTEFLLFILPILRVGKWRRWWARFTRKLNTSPSTDGPEAGKTGELSFLPEKTCAICYKDQSKPGELGGGGGIETRETGVTNPYETVECGCVYCYVCVATKIQLEEGEGWECLRCGTLCRKCRPWAKGGAKAGDAVGTFGSDGEEGEDGTEVSETEDEEGYERLGRSEVTESEEGGTVVRDDGSDTTERGVWRNRASSGTGSRGRSLGGWERGESDEEEEVFATAEGSEVESDGEEVRRIF
ncbi:hypothetical protein BJ508DRAFT_364391 [Ascobolus immersus RN42]|uniref:Pex N-terminal domain-containing protein n=1 Tax=Ascobolus immersus RN42 TaxID=1160509 RepID=A0A3N4HUR0_ASCIM|nr:hypothetical protein BJ508DRAFT_364391 [Ascobolus immersus RN42]